MIQAQDRRDPVVLELLIDARLHDELLAYSDALVSDPDYIAKAILRAHLAALRQSGKQNGKERNRKR